MVERRTHLGQFALIPEQTARDAALKLRIMGEQALADIISGAVVYEPDNHHNAALCPYCTPRGTRPEGYLQNDVEALLCLRLNEEDVFMPGHPRAERLKEARRLARLMRSLPRGDGDA